MGEIITHLLIVDDDDRIRTLLTKYLHEQKFLTSSAKDGKEALLLLKEFVFDLAIIDVMMPEIDGYMLASIIRENSNLPILMLTAMDSIDYKIKGFEFGINDYLSKPFDPRELTYRIKNILNLNRKNPDLKNYISFGSFKYDIKNHRLLKDETMVNLTHAEAKLLAILLENKNIIISREKLASLLGGINERSIDVQIIRLRSKIENDPKNPYFLQTIRGSGYVFYI